MNNEVEQLQWHLKTLSSPQKGNLLKNLKFSLKVNLFVFFKIMISLLSDGSQTSSFVLPKELFLTRPNNLYQEVSR